jgi:hypothetical protein
MLKNKRVGSFAASLIVSFVFIVQPSLAQTNAPPVAPIPSQIASAHKIFIANGGDICFDAQKLGGAPNHAYNRFYADTKSSGRYELVGTPEEADLVFEVRLDCPPGETGRVESYNGELWVSIIDPKAHVTIWTASEPVEGAFLTSTANKNLATASRALVSDLTGLAASPPASAAH